MKRDGDRARRRCDGDRAFSLSLSLITFTFVSLLESTSSLTLNRRLVETHVIHNERMKELSTKKKKKKRSTRKFYVFDVKQRRRRRENVNGKRRMAQEGRTEDKWKFGIRGILDAANVESNKISGRRYDPITGHDAIITTVGSDFKVLIGDSGDCISNDPSIPRPFHFSSFLFLILPYKIKQVRTYIISIKLRISLLKNVKSFLFLCISKVVFHCY